MTKMKIFNEQANSIVNAINNKMSILEVFKNVICEIDACGDNVVDGSMRPMIVNYDNKYIKNFRFVVDCYVNVEVAQNIYLTLFISNNKIYVCSTDLFESDAWNKICICETGTTFEEICNIINKYIDGKVD